MASEKLPRKIATASPEAQAEALEQADQYDSMFGTVPLTLEGDEPLQIPPHPDYSMLDDEKMQAWDELMFTVDTVYDREPDVYIPEQKLQGLTLPAETRRGALKIPFRITDAEGKTELVRPPHSIKVVQIALGEEGYKRLIEGGRNAADVWKIWGTQSIRIKERQQGDSKSNASAVAVAPVSEATG